MYPPVELHAGENATVAVHLPPNADAPLVYEQGPGEWPTWATLNATTGALNLTPPAHLVGASSVSESGRSREISTAAARGTSARRVWRLGVAVVVLDAHAVTGLARRVVHAAVTLL